MFVVTEIELATIWVADEYTIYYNREEEKEVDFFGSMQSVYEQFPPLAK
jgi:hypothetical protein